VHIFFLGGRFFWSIVLGPDVFFLGGRFFSPTFSSSQVVGLHRGTMYSMSEVTTDRHKYQIDKGAAGLQI
jgi:hypothetical protein